MGKTEQQSEHHCTLCGSCGLKPKDGVTISGFRLILSAFVVFIMPLFFAVISANIVHIYYNKNNFPVTILAVVAGIILGILLAKLIVKLIIRSVPHQD